MRQKQCKAKKREINTRNNMDRMNIHWFGIAKIRYLYKTKEAYVLTNPIEF